MEWVPANPLTITVVTWLDPLQFAYKSNRATENAVLTLLFTVTKHFINPEGYVRDLFVDCSSAFNCMKTHIPLKRLIDLNINTRLVDRTENEPAYLALITAVQTWYHTSQLEINAAKPKELIICSKLDLTFDPISLDGHCWNTGKL